MVEFYDSGSYVDLYGKIKTTFPTRRQEVISKYIKENGISVDSFLDVACGTGFFLNLIQKNLNLSKCVGLDYSKKMIDYAKNNFANEHIQYVYGDMSNFDLKKKFDFISCNYDAINFLTDFEDWKKTFKCIYDHLNENGVFTFDYNTIKKMKIIKNGCILKESDYCDIVEHADNNNNKINLKYTIYSKQENGLFKKEVLTLTEGVFTRSMILKALRDAGFKNIKFCNENFKKCNTRKALRLFVICNK